MRDPFVALLLTAFAATALHGCSGDKTTVKNGNANLETTDVSSAGASKSAISLKAKSPHHVMVALADATPLTRDQQAYVIGLQDKIAFFWEPLPAKLKYSVGIEFTVSRNGVLSDNLNNVSSMGTRRAIEQCRRAIMLAGRSPHFDPLPAQFKSEPVTFICEFVYNPPAVSK